MSALDNMLADMLKKAIPPEIAELLTPEKMQEFGDKINGYIVDTRQRLERIENRVDLYQKNLLQLSQNIIDSREAINLRLDKLIERIEENDRHNNSSSRRGRKPLDLGPDN